MTGSFLQLTKADTSSGTVTLQSGAKLPMLKLHLWCVEQDGTDSHRRQEMPALWMTLDVAEALIQGLTAKLQRLQEQSGQPSAGHRPN